MHFTLSNQYLKISQITTVVANNKYIRENAIQSSSTLQPIDRKPNISTRKQEEKENKDFFLLYICIVSVLKNKFKSEESFYIMI